MDEDRGLFMLGVPLAFAGGCLTLVGAVGAVFGAAWVAAWLVVGAICLLVGTPLGLRDSQGFTDVGAWIAMGTLVVNALIYAAVVL